MTRPILVSHYRDRHYWLHHRPDYISPDRPRGPTFLPVCSIPEQPLRKPFSADIKFDKEIWVTILFYQIIEEMEK